MSLENTDPIAALAALNAAHERVEKAAVAIREYAEAQDNASKIQRDFDALVNYLRTNAPEGTYWHLNYGDS